MTLAKRLVKTGVTLDQDIGFIVEICDDEGDWVPTHAVIARVCEKPPDNTQHHAQIQEYDPDYSLMMEWEEDNLTYVSILSLTDDAELYELEESGLIFDSPDRRIFIGQTPEFMDSVGSCCCALKNGLN